MKYLGIHHIRFAVDNPEQFSRFLIQHFGFQYFAHRLNNPSAQSSIAVKHHSVVFVIDKRNHDNTVLEVNGNLPNLFLNGNVNYPVDTVCDACFQCNNIDEILERVKTTQKGSCVIRSKVEDLNGTVSYAVIQSPFGNLQHTLVDLSNYSGKFLPGFQINHNYVNSNHHYVECIDHLAYMVPTGLADSAIDWYNFVFEFERLFINKNDEVNEGFKVEHGPMGMRLKAIHGIDQFAPKCTGDFSSDMYIAPVKFVFGEPLSSSTSDQISTFLEEHRGMGIQHIGLGTRNILEAVNHFKQLGASFVAPPIEYYHDMNRIEEIEDLNITTDQLMKSGILVESSDSDNTEVLLPPDVNSWYIMQVFTKNLFKEQTFFLELIQRHRTQGGFGAGNIKALWSGVQAHLEKVKELEN
uniref:4-hydroxyphenylpyruvate dioxygenase-like protein n=1 Tax=Styela clava TaxID=7725 RepID=UPI001939D1F3|nr:4-hydroxyphenylpyruvate dioxygenase-like protein [Styela clava]